MAPILHVLTLSLNLFGAMLINTTAENPSDKIQPMKIKLISGDLVLNAALYDNATSRDLFSMLPLTVTLEDYASTELIFYTDRKLTSEDAPDGYEPTRGDITYYAPWGDVAIFYKGFRYSSGLISLGTINKDDLDKLNYLSGKEVIIEPVE